MICPITNKECRTNGCGEKCYKRDSLEQHEFIQQAFTEIKAERVVIPCILIATKLLATEEQQKELEELLLKIKCNFIVNLIKALKNEVR